MYILQYYLLFVFVDLPLPQVGGKKSPELLLMNRIASFEVTSTPCVINTSAPGDKLDRLLRPSPGLSFPQVSRGLFPSGGVPLRMPCAVRHERLAFGHCPFFASFPQVFMPKTAHSQHEAKIDPAFFHPVFLTMLFLAVKFPGLGVELIASSIS